ncbi:hypothetical protein [Nitrosomonas sp.]|uniref:hypothetical protein n=1 Tax=Nitrosomonas sp. TaxID=42353 RepID=UPI001D4C63F5|nr:hypothetical protein [Nitrosomonas sp.]MBX3616091.1 hypothetical protein [Nitrosomonas sp.]
MNFPHKWRFFRSGGFDQVRLDTAADLKALGELDPKLWAALSCPVDNLEFDARTLQLIDIDHDGHIRVPEIIAATNWASALLKNPEDLLYGRTDLSLNAINDNTTEGATVLASAKHILQNIGKSGESIITIEDTADLSRIYASTQFNGDGIIPAESADKADVQQVIREIIQCIGSETDRSGLPGISEQKIEQFFTEARAYSGWWQTSEKNAQNILPLGETTEAAKKLLDRIQAKINDYFTRCQIAQYDQRAAESLNPVLAEYEAFTKIDLSAQSQQVAVLPLATISANKSLPLENGINPAWFDAITEFKRTIADPLLGPQTALTYAQWRQLCQQFSAHQAWLETKQGAAVESLGIRRVREILGGGYQQKLLHLIEQDKSLADTLDAIYSVEKLIRLHRDLYHLLNNFVSFRDFYTAQNKAIFLAGSLYLDGRTCDFCLRVSDINKHSSMANLSGTYLAYCECQRQGGTEKINIVAAFTDGDADNLMIGRNGIFYDRNNQDWDATIVKIIEHPISVRQSFWYPFKRIGKMVGEQLEKFASAREKSVQDQAAVGISGATQTIDTTKTAPPAPFDVGKFAGIFAAIGLAIGAIGTAVASIVTGFISLTWWQMPLTILSIILVISGPSMLLAYLKLRKRNLAPLLDGNGWAVNTRAIINIPFGASLTKLATLPPGAQRSLADPYAEKQRPWKLYLIVLMLLTTIAILWQHGAFDQLVQSFSKNTDSAEQPAGAQPSTAAATAPSEAAKENNKLPAIATEAVTLPTETTHKQSAPMPATKPMAR